MAFLVFRMHGDCRLDFFFFCGTEQWCCSKESWFPLGIGVIFTEHQTLKCLLSACISSVQPAGHCHLKWQGPHFHTCLPPSPLGLISLNWDEMFPLLFYSWVLTFPLGPYKSAWASLFHATLRFVDVCIFLSQDGNTEHCDGLRG